MVTRKIVLILNLVLACGCRPKPMTTSPDLGPVEPQSSMRFEELTGQCGITATYQNGRDQELYSIVETLGGGVGLNDFDRDGALDVILPGGGTFDSAARQLTGFLPHLYRNLGHTRWQDVSEASHLTMARHYSHGVSLADFDNDGFDDLVITGYGGCDLWRNQGDGTWELMAPGLRDDQWSTGAGWGDLDGDGNLDLYVVHYVNWTFDNHPDCPSPSQRHPRDVCSPRRFDGLKDTLFRNSGQGEFEDATHWGLVEGGKGLGVLLADLDDDSDTDIYVANDTVNNFLYINQGDGKLEESALFQGCAVDFQGKPNGSMGLELVDFDHDGAGDLWVTNFEQENFCLYRQLPGGLFLDVSKDTGISDLGGLYVGFGTVSRDFDGDGDRDIAVANGHVVYYPGKAPFEQQSILLENNWPDRFRKVNFPEQSFFSKEFAARGLAAGDFDGDGRTDLVFSTLNGPAHLLRNTTEQKGQALRIRLAGREANRNGIGSRITLHTKQGDRVQSLAGGASYLSTSELVCEFYVPADSPPLDATISWAYGSTQKVVSLQPGKSYIVTEPVMADRRAVFQLP